VILEDQLAEAQELNRQYERGTPGTPGTTAR
jgi:hypothetical protein